LYLKVGESGSASWFYRYRLSDKRREMGVGPRDAVGLAEARDAAKDAAGLVRKGIDPIEERRRVKAENLARSRAKPTTTAFREMAEDYLKAHGADWKGRYARSMCWNALAKYAMPIIGDLSLDQIELSHIAAIMQRAKDAGAPEQARRVRAAVELVLNRAIRAGGKAVGNPADAKLHPSRRQGERPHYRAVDLDEAPAIFCELKARSGASAAFAAWTFMILCASRPSEALNAQWREVDLDRKLWVVPASRMKSGREHRVPLSQAALEILDRQMTVRTGDAIFPGRGGSPLSYDTFASAPARAGIDAATPHGWRSVFRDWAGDIGDVPRDLAEAALAHSLLSVEASYRRRTAVERRRSVMTRYSDWLTDAKVVAFPSSKKA
jgi:integrase